MNRSAISDHLFSANGRTNRRQYLACLALFIGGCILLGLVNAFIVRTSNVAVTELWVIALMLLTLLIPSVRRFHDIGQSGLLVGFLLLPFLNLLALAALLLWPGNKGVNKWGPQPMQDVEIQHHSGEETAPES